MNRVLELYWCFFKIGLVNFGGGYAMLPLLQRELVEDRQWISGERLTDYFAVSQCTPGTIAMNVSTFIGYEVAGVPGSIAATSGFLTAPMIIITIIAAFLKNFASIEIVQHAFAGIRVCVCVLILNAVIKLWNNSVVDKKTLALYIVILLLMLFGKYLPVALPAAVLVILSGLFGVIAGREKESSKEEAEEGSK